MCDYDRFLSDLSDKLGLLDDRNRLRSIIEYLKDKKVLLQIEDFDELQKSSCDKFLKAILTETEYVIVVMT